MMRDTATNPATGAGDAAASRGAPALAVRDARDDEREAMRDLTVRANAAYAAVMEPAAWQGLERGLAAALRTEGPVERIVAESGGVLVGSVLLYPAGMDPYRGLAPLTPWPEVRLLAVPPEARGRGVGRALMDECVRRARAAGARSLGLHTSRSMATAIGMYERMGFVRWPEHDFRPPGAELVTAYRLVLADDAGAPADAS